MKFLHTSCFLSLFVLSACLGAQNPAPVTTYGGGSGAGSAGSHVVQDGDTLWSISKRYKIVMRDIAFANKLQAPFMLDAGQRLQLPPPPEYRVRAGDSLYEISRLFNTSTSELARLNNIEAPYVVRSGQVLRLPSVRPKPTQIQTTRAIDKVPANVSNEQGSIVQAQVAKPKGVKSRPVKVTKAPPKRSSSKFLKPVSGKVISGYGPKKGGLHNDGINIAAPRGTSVQAAENGVVVYVGNELRGFGNLILVRHEGRYMSAYAHLDNFKITRGATVKRGQVIGTVGSTGSVSSPQLHFEIRKGTRAVNPKTYLAG